MSYTNFAQEFFSCSGRKSLGNSELFKDFSTQNKEKNKQNVEAILTFSTIRIKAYHHKKLSRNSVITVKNNW